MKQGPFDGESRLWRDIVYQTVVFSLNQSSCLYIYIKYSFYLSYSTSIVQRDVAHTNFVRFTKSAIPSFTASLRALTEVVKMDSAFPPNHARWTQSVDSPRLAPIITILDTKLVSTIWTLGTPCVMTGTGSRCTIRNQTRVRLFTTVLTTDEIIYDLLQTHNMNFVHKYAEISAFSVVSVKWQSC